MTGMKEGYHDRHDRYMIMKWSMIERLTRYGIAYGVWDNCFRRSWVFILAL